MKNNELDAYKKYYLQSEKLLKYIFSNFSIIDEHSHISNLNIAKKWINKIKNDTN